MFHTNGRLWKWLVWVVVGLFSVSAVSVHAERYVITGPEGNTIEFDDDSISGEFEGLEYSVTEEEASVDGVSTSDGGGGGGGSDTAIIVGGVVLVAVVVGVGLWWYFKHRQPRRTALKVEENALVLHELRRDVEVVLRPELLQDAQCDSHSAPPGEEDLKSFDLALRVRF